MQSILERSRSSKSAKDSTDALEVFENERFDIKSVTWGPENLLSTDPKRYQSSHGQSESFPNIPLPIDFVYIGDWEIDGHVGGSTDGWSYSTNFLELNLNHCQEQSSRTTVRRRRWIRRIEADRSSAGSGSAIGSAADSLPSRSRSNTASSQGNKAAESPSASRLTIAALSPSGKASAPGALLGALVDQDKSLSIQFDLNDCEMEYEEDSVKDTDSVCSDVPTGAAYAAYVASAAVAATAAANAANAAAASKPPPVPVQALPKKRNSFFSVFTGGSSSSSAPPPPPASTATASTPTATPTVPKPVYQAEACLKVHGTTLSALGKQIKFLEDVSKKEDEASKKHWKDTVKPKLEKQIGLLEKQVTVLKQKLEKLAAVGGDISALDEELRKLNLEVDGLKRQLYFPFSAYTLGQGGVYLGLDDYWLQHASGSYLIELTNDQHLPIIRMELTGANNTEGVQTRLKLEGLRLQGDKGSGVPRLSFDNLTITVAFSLKIKISYNLQTKKWILPKQDFNLKLLSFKGPYGLNRSVVSIVISLLTPTIRSQLLAVIPYELGLLVKTLPCPCVIRGQFHLNGVDLGLLSTEIHKVDKLGEMCKYTALQMEMFYWMQKALDRTHSMKTMSDLIAYIHTHSSNGPVWRQLVHLWSQAAEIYCEKVILAKQDGSFSSSSTPTPGVDAAYTINFQTFLTAAEELLRKRISIHSKLQHIECQLSVNHMLSFVFQIVERLLEESMIKATALQKVRLGVLVNTLRDNYQVALQVLRMITKNLDFAQLSLSTSIHAGPQGYMEMIIREILAQAPLLLAFNFSKEKNLGALPLVPYILSVKPQRNGDIIVEIYHFTHDSGELPSAEAATYDAEQTYNTQNIRTGVYSTSYNRIVNSITNLKATEDMTTSGFVLRNKPPSSTPIKQADGVLATDGHLLVREQEQLALLEELLTDHPIGNQADTVLAVTTSSPHVSFIVDKAASLKPGAELFTLLLGPQKDDWKPFGSPNMFVEDQLSEKRRTPTDGMDPKFTPEYESASFDHPTEQSKNKPGCPIMMQTSPGIKLLVQVPKVSVNVALPSLVRFFLAHFVDLQLLKAYLESLIGGEFYEDQLIMIKMIVEKIAKYLLLPGLDVDINLSTKIVTLNGEIMVRIDTPKDPEEEITGVHTSCAIEFKAQLSLKQLVEDGKDIEAYLTKNAVATAIATGVVEGSF